MSLLLLFGVPVVTPGAFINPNTPNITDFETFLATSVQLPTGVLAANSPWPQYALTQALGLVINLPGACYSGILYTLAVYNCAVHILFSITPDQTGQTYFADVRGNNSSSIPPGFGLNSATTGLVVTSSDQGSSVGLTAPTWAAGMTVASLDFYKTPWGRAFLAWNQSFGPTIWGLT